MGVQDFGVILFVVDFCFQAQVLISQNLMCHPNDLNALEDFMSGLQSDIVGWGMDFSSDCCKWAGITCISSSSLVLIHLLDTYRVTELDVPSKRLMGNLSESLGNFEQLRALNLSHNFLKNSLPINLFQLPNLELLDLSSNEFSGPIPVYMNLPSIQSLDLSQNLLNGSVSPRICANQTELQVLNLADNYFSDNIPPGLGNCSSLEAIHLGPNSFSGAIPEGLFGMQKLTQLNIQNNNLSGELSKEVGNLINLVRLDISTNRFSGTIPDVFHSLGRLHDFVAHSNNLSGGVPPSLLSSESISLLNIRNNSLEGTIHLNCSAMTSLVSLDLGSNHFGGAIPSNLPSCRHLSNINLARNKLSGQIPASFKDFHTLNYLSISNSSISNLSSALHILQQCENLTTLALAMNLYGEELPADPTLHFARLEVLINANCRLTGPIPKWLSNSRRLQLLDLSWNFLDGTIPMWFDDFDHLFYLDVSNNSFTGNVPRSITGLLRLITGNISFEEPSPAFTLFIRRNVGARGLQYNSSFPRTLDFSNNNLSGLIWPEFGNLKLLHVLGLGFNSLSGPILSNLSWMSSLETLDLSHNKLSGSIPPSLVHLSFLSKFSVANNQLEGKIPTGGQFMTFPNSSFEGNSNLCGFHAPSCPSNSTSEVDGGSPPPRKSTVELEGVYIGIAVGFAFGVACFIVTDRYVWTWHF